MTKNISQNSASAKKSTQQKSVNLQRIYIKDVSFETLRVPQVFGADWKPKLDLNIRHQSQILDKGLEESQLKITITAKIDNKIAFAMEIVQAGVFQLQNLIDAEKDYVRHVTFPTTLFPYAREAIDSLMVKAGMPPIMLAQVNFEALFRSKKSGDKKESPDPIKVNEDTRKIN